MGEKGITFLGTLFLVTFNVLLGIISSIALKSLELKWALLFIIPFFAGAIYFDIIVIKYFINKIKEKRDELK